MRRTSTAHLPRTSLAKALNKRRNVAIPINQSVKQDLQVDLFYYLGLAFLLSMSVLLGLVMISHLRPGNGPTSGDKSG